MTRTVQLNFRLVGDEQDRWRQGEVHILPENMGENQKWLDLFLSEDFVVTIQVDQILEYFIGDKPVEAEAV